MLVSVVITTCNRPLLLKRAIDSVLNQTYRNIEIIVSDDCSDVDTEKLVSSYINNQSITIKYRKNNRRMGACYTRNEGIRLAQGEFITGLDDDDAFELSRIQCFLDNYDDKFSFISSNIMVVDKNRSFKLFGKGQEISRNHLFWYNFVGNQVFVNRERILNVGGFDTSLTSAQDLDLWVRLIEKYGTALRIQDATYKLYIDHDEPRITTSNNKISGLVSFYEKHKSLMTKQEMKFYKLKIEYWKNNRKPKFSYFRYISFPLVCFYLKWFVSRVVR